MTFTFLHTADWQIGRAFGGFEPAKREQLRAARLAIIERLGAISATIGAEHVLVAGDVFDSALVPDRLIAQALARLAGQGRTTWHLLPGNHDPARAGGVWERVAAIGVPANVRLHLLPQPSELAAGAILLPAPLVAKASSLDPTEWMTRSETPAGALRIGLAHGSVRGFGSSGEPGHLIAIDRERSARLDYLALGDWHGVARIAERTWYSGTPEPDRYPDNEPGHALVVRLSAGEAAVERVPTAQFVWAHRQVEVRGSADLEALEREARDLAPSLDRLLLQVVLAGSVGVAERVAIEARLARLDPALFHLDTDLSGLRTLIGQADQGQLAAGPLRQAADRLQAIAEDAADPRAPAAALALRKLHQLAESVPAGVSDGADRP
jgi:DNA repair exonuclease SbcCD nuclease subunit